MLSVTYKPFMLSAIVLNIIMLSVVGPSEHLCNKLFFFLFCAIDFNKKESLSFALIHYTIAPILGFSKRGIA